MNLLEHYIIEVRSIKYFDTGVEVEALCDCWGDKRICTHWTTLEAWKKEQEQGYFLA